ncbi:MAG: glycosyltransferase family 2 protein [Candidatus Omnitrophica bacterium]|nr:glycosyltransferase family 2 protein [Candidatus Omnitrophota bacterium]
MEYSVVIPVFNEEGSLEILQGQLSSILDKITDDYEIIYVDDGSTDSSLEILKKLKSKYQKIKIISLKRNYGQSAAFFAGFKYAKGAWLITLDSDLQNPPDQILALIKEKDNFDFITGVRKKRKDNFLKKVSSKIARFFRWLILADVTLDTGCSLRLFKREIIDVIPFFKNFHRFFTFLVRNFGFKIKEIEVEHNRRMIGKSKYTTLKRLKEGIFDLIGVFWLKRRLIKIKIKYEG